MAGANAHVSQADGAGSSLSFLDVAHERVEHHVPDELKRAYIPEL